MIDKFGIINAAKCFSLGIFQNYLVFIPAKTYIKYFTSTTQVESLQSNGMSGESLEYITKSDSNFKPTFPDHYLLRGMNFNGHCLIKNNISISKKVINLYISYTLGPQFSHSNTDFILNNCLFGSAKLSKNVDLDKYKYTDYGIGRDSRPEFSFTDGSYEKNFIIFGANMSSSVYVDNKGKDILFLGERPTQGLGGTKFAIEAKYPTNFTIRKKICIKSTMQWKQQFFVY